MKKPKNRYGTDLRTETLYLRVTKEVKKRWNREARRRNVSQSTLVEKVVEEAEIGKTQK